MQLSDKYPFLTNYFLQAKNNDNYSVFQSILFYGSDLKAQYNLALYISKLLNCEKDFDEYCTCQNCRWIDSYEHPAVITVSKIDYKSTEDKTKTVISINQAKMIKNSLTTTSDYHRVFIFCGNSEGRTYLPDISYDLFQDMFFPEEDFYLDETGNPVFFVQPGILTPEEDGVLLFPVSLEFILDEI